MSNNEQPLLPSRFHSLRDTEPHPTTWDELVAEIRSERHRQVTEQYRRLGDKQQQIDLKSRQPAFIPSVALKPGGRTAAHITGYTGLIMVDLDGIAPELFRHTLATVKADKHGFLVYVTLSGTGIRVVCRVDVEVTKQNFSAVWHAVNDYYARLTGIAVDAQCKNATRMSVLCHDPEVLYRPDAPPLPVDALLQTLAGKRQRERRRPGRPVDAAGAAPTVRRLVEEGGIRYAEGSHNAYISRCLYWMNRFGVAEADVQAWALDAFSDYDATHHSVAATVRSCYALTAEHGTHRVHWFRKGSNGKDGSDGNNGRGGGCRPVKATVAEMEAFVSRWGAFRMNRLINQLEVKVIATTPPYGHPSSPEEGSLDSPTLVNLSPCSLVNLSPCSLVNLSPCSLVTWHRMTDQLENSLWRAMQHAGLETDVFRLRTLLLSDFVPDYHPLTEYLNALPPWDGTTDYIRRVSGMVHCRATSADEFDFYFRRWFVGLLAGALSERVVNNVILVLLGPQGSYKSSFMSKLLPPELHRYYTVKTNSQRLTKDDAFAMTENLLINFEEIDSMQRPELNQLKALTTAEYVNERPAYGRNKVRLPHVATFCGTGNNLQFLTDDTGNRRWLPFEVERIDNPWQVTLPYEGLYSQAYHLLRTGFRYWFDQKEVDELNARNRRFEAPNPARELILAYYRKPTELEKSRCMNSTQIVARFGAGIRLNPVQVGRAMKELGFEQVHIHNTRFWLVVERSGTEMASLLPAPATDATDTF